MLVTIGLNNVAGQLSYEVELTEEQLMEAWKDARQQSGFLDFTDVKGDRAVFAADAIAYVTVRTDRSRKVGFGRA